MFLFHPLLFSISNEIENKSIIYWTPSIKRGEHSYAQPSALPLAYICMCVCVWKEREGYSDAPLQTLFSLPASLSLSLSLSHTLTLSWAKGRWRVWTPFERRVNPLFPPPPLLIQSWVQSQVAFRLVLTYIVERWLRRKKKTRWNIHTSLAAYMTLFSLYKWSFDKLTSCPILRRNDSLHSNRALTLRGDASSPHPPNIHTWTRVSLCRMDSTCIVSYRSIAPYHDD
jgi:hypothetical protein